MAQTDDPKTSDHDDEKLREEGLRALKAERADNAKLAKQLKELQDKLDAAETEKLSKEEKLQKQLNEATAKVKALESAKELDGIRSKVAKDTGISVDLLSKVEGDEASIKEFAEELKAHIEGSTSPKAPEPNRFLDQDQSDSGDDTSDALSALGFSS